MTSKKQRIANRENAQLSTGPRTKHSKFIVSQNALKHGLSAQNPILPDEDPQLFHKLSEQLNAELQPVGEVERALVMLITGKLWRIARVSRIETGVLIREHYQALLDRAREEADRYKRTVFDELDDQDTTITDEAAYTEALNQIQATREQRDREISIDSHAFWRDASGNEILTKLTRYETTLERGLYRALAELKQLQTLRIDEGQHNGFVLQKGPQD
jgi:hypothetical protein